MYVLFIFHPFALVLWFSAHRLRSPLLAFHLINQPAAEVLSALASQIETRLWLAGGRLPSPSANAGLDSYRVSSHYRQSRVPGRQWEESGRGMERRGPEAWSSITPQAPCRPAATPPKHSPVRLTCSQKPATPLWGVRAASQREGEKDNQRARLGASCNSCTVHVPLKSLISLWHKSKISIHSFRSSDVLRYNPEEHCLHRSG